MEREKIRELMTLVDEAQSLIVGAKNRIEQVIAGHVYDRDMVAAHAIVMLVKALAVLDRVWAELREAEEIGEE